MRKRLPLFALLAANAISFTGNAMSMVAVPWFVLETTGSASQTGITAAVIAVAAILAALVGGSAVDRLGYKRMSVVSDLASAVPVALVPILHHTTGLAFWQLLVLVFLSALLDTPGNSARLALVPELAAKAEMPLERANAAMQSLQRGANLVGAPIAGLLIAVLGAANVLLIDAATFAVSAVLVAPLFEDQRLLLGQAAAHGEGRLRQEDGLAVVAGGGRVAGVSHEVSFRRV